MANQRIRSYAKENKVKHWEIAARIPMNEQIFSRKLRYELSEEETANILKIIDDIAKNRL